VMQSKGVNSVQEGDVLRFCFKKGRILRSELWYPRIIVDLDEGGDVLRIEVENFQATPIDKVDSVFRQFGLDVDLEGLYLSRAC
jgi:acetamidase/formamidase